MTKPDWHDGFAVGAVLTSLAERCRDQPMEMADLIHRAAELLGMVGNPMNISFDEWKRKRDQWFIDARKDK